MALTPTQLTTLKAAILAETNPGFVQARADGNAGAMADFYNAESSPAFYVWRSSTQTTDIAAAISWASFTPADTPDGTAIYTNRALVCALKRDNMRVLLERESLPTDRLSTRQSLTDALQNVPAGVGGVSLDAGWLGAGRVKDIIARVATRGERLYVTGTGTSGQPGSLTFEGDIGVADIVNALRS